MRFIDALKRVVAKHGGRPAVVESGRVALTYRSLWERAGAIADQLRSLGAGPERVVALERRKSADYVASLIGIWRAGAAFVPIDPALPDERRGFLHRDSGAGWIVDEIGGRRLANPPRSAGCDLVHQRNKSLAYVIYTSGSSGRPKGVALTQHGLLNVLRSQIRAFRLTPASRSLFYLSTSFDASISDLGTTLLAGASLFIERPESLVPGPKLVDLLRRRGITHLDFPPSMLPLLDPETVPSTLRTLILGGEACAPALIRRWSSRVRVVNVYGPTEATICTSLGACSPKTWDRPLLGRPLPGIEYRVRNGELLISGACLARGYVNLPKLTAQRFITLGGKRWYRTGDRVLERADGEFEFLGRIDRQIKLRGLRIEPGEIEAALRSHEEVAHAAVVKRAEGLAAFVVPANGHPPTPRGLRAHLARTLPVWMIPSRFEVIEDLPRLANGKTDFEALGRVPMGREASSRAAAPRRGVAAELRSIWREVLKADSVGLNEDFFDLGGDSLRALEVVVAAEERGIALSPSWMVDGVTIAGLIRRLREPRGSGSAVLSAAALRRDVAWTPAWRKILETAARRPAARQGPSRTIFLTGATGFLGSQVLRELLARTNAVIRCLVRGQGRLDLRSGRVIEVPGDLDEERFGLDREVWRRLADEVDSVYHCGATVHLTRTYDALRRTNVAGTLEALRLVCDGKAKRLHYASTLSVFVATDRNTGAMREDDDLSRTRRVYGGYAQSKWAAEVMVRAAAEFVGPVDVYRFGLITGDSKTGAGARSDLLRHFVRGTAAAGCVPEGAGRRLHVDVTPVDYAARAMVEQSLRAPGGETVHIANPRSASLSDLVAAMRRVGLPIDEVPLPQWRARVAGNESAAYLALCRPMESYGRLRTLDLFQATGARFDLRRSGFTCPRPTRRLLDLYIRSILAVP
jgi:amino acid adenylation domain-containing protein/thioester reductase-like protein